MKQLISLPILFVLVASPVWADVQPMRCQAFDQSGKQIRDVLSFYASRGSKEFSLSKDEGLVLDFSWPFCDGPVTVTLIKNPYFPWNIPFTQKTLGEGELRPDSDGQISGNVQLESGAEVFTVQCSYQP